MLEVESSSNPVAPNPTQIELTINGQVIDLPPYLSSRYLATYCTGTTLLPETVRQTLWSDHLRHVNFSKMTAQKIEYEGHSHIELVENCYIATEEQLRLHYFFAEMDADEVAKILSTRLEAQEKSYKDNGGHSGVMQQRAAFIEKHTESGTKEEFSKNEKLAALAHPLKIFKPFDKLLIENPQLAVQYQQGLTGITQTLLAAASNFDVQMPKYQSPKTASRVASLCVMPDSSLKTSMSRSVELKGPETEVAFSPFDYEEQARIAFEGDTLKIDIQLRSDSKDEFTNEFFLATVGYSLTSWLNVNEINNLLKKIKQAEKKSSVPYTGDSQHRLILQAIITGLENYVTFLSNPHTPPSERHLPLSYLFSTLQEHSGEFLETLKAAPEQEQAFLSFERNPLLRILLACGGAAVKRCLLEQDRSFNHLFSAGLPYATNSAIESVRVAPMRLQQKLLANLAYIEAIVLSFPLLFSTEVIEEEGEQKIKQKNHRVIRLLNMAKDWQKAFNEFAQQKHSYYDEQRLIAKFINLMTGAENVKSDLAGLNLPRPIKKLFESKINEISKTLVKQLKQLVKEQPEFEEVVRGKLGESSRCWKLSKPRCIP